MALHAVDQGIWEVSCPQKVLGVEFGHRMTVVQLSSGDLWVHSPVALDQVTKNDIRELGTPRYFVAPNAFHDMYWHPYFQAFQDAEFHGAPGMPSSLTFTHTLSDVLPNDWADDFVGIPTLGMPKLNEHVYIHKASKTLILADLVFNFGERNSFWERSFLKLNDVHDKVGPSRLFRAFIKDKKAFRETVDRILTCDFDRIIVGHGQNIETGGKKVLEQAYSFL